MKPSHIASALNHCIDKRRPVFLWGAPGVGKSDVVASVALQRKVELRDVRLSLLDPVDLKGFPTPDIKKRQMTWLPADFLPRDGEGILFLDELNAAPASVQAAAYQLILNRKIGEYELPDGWAIVAAGNRDGDRGVTHRMPSPLANRLIHIDFDINIEDWTQWAVDHNIDPTVLAFIRFRPNLLHDFKPADNPRAFPSPRSWSFVNDIYKSHLQRDVEFELIKGTVGDGASSEFVAFVRTIKDLPTIDEILLNPAKIKVPDNPATQYALVTALGMKANANSFDKLMMFIERMPQEYQVVFVRDAARRDKALANSPTFTKWALKNEAVFV